MTWTTEEMSQIIDGAKTQIDCEFGEVIVPARSDSDE